MSLLALQVHHLRNLRELSIQPSSRFNLVCGDNGSGKTSLLEAIYILGRAKSFRTRHLKQAITFQQNSTLIWGKTPHNVSMGLEFNREGRASIRINEHTVKQSSELASYLPLLFMGTESSRLLSSGSRQRRRCLDWGVFHVEHRFFNHWQRFNRALKQRNSALRQASKNGATAWHYELAENAQALDECRKRYLQQLQPLFEVYVERLLGDSFNLKIIRYERGWSSDKDYFELLESNFESDRQMGFTQRGPHRADINVYTEGGVLTTHASGGQLKLVTTALFLAQVALLSQMTGRQTVLLIDDLPAELDQAHRRLFIELLIELDSQLFITATDSELIDHSGFSDKKMFHVEQGKVRVLE